VSAPAIRAWNNVTPQQLEEALSRLHPDDRPSYDATVAVGQAAAVLTNGKKGYCDSTTRQFYDHLKGAYGESVIRNALWALQVAGVTASVRGGTIGKDGKGRGAHRVFVDADTNGLIPDGYVPPPPRRDPPTGHDLSQTWDASNTGRRDSRTSKDESDTGHDLSTPKESISSSTAALAGRSTTEDSLGLIDTQESEMPPPCETCAQWATDEATRKLARTVSSDEQLMQGKSYPRRRTMAKDAEGIARVLRAHYPTRSVPELTTVLKEAICERQAGRLIGPARHGHILEIAAQRLN
jgi:hypothetical protein